MTIQTMPCYRCKTEITIRPNVKYCKVCAPIVKKEQNVAKSSFKTEQRRQDREAKRKVEKDRTGYRPGILRNLRSFKMARLQAPPPD